MRVLSPIILSILFFIFLLLSCSTPERQIQSDRKITSNYSELWHEVDSLQDKGLPRSAVEKVREIKKLAARDQDNEQLIKSVILENRFQIELEEDGLENSIGRIRQEITVHDFPARAILRSYLAELYHQYLQANQWHLAERVAQQNSSGDLSKMSAVDLQRQSANLYLKSIEHPDSLQQPLSEFNNILIHRNSTSPGKDNATLYDVLMARALDHFEFTGNLGSLPQTPFFLDKPEFFASRDQFVQIEITTADSNNTYLAMKVYQSGLTDPNLKLDLRRLNFVLDNSILSNKKDLYIKAMDDLKGQYQDTGDQAQVNFQLASFYYRELSDFKTAHQLCQSTLNQFRQNEAARQCKDLISIIERPQLEIQMEEVVIPDQEILVNIRFRNLSQVYGRILELSEYQLEEFNNLNPGAQLASLMAKVPTHEIQVHLPDTDDFKEHGTEIKIDGKSPGRFFLILASSPQFDAEEDIIVASQFDVSNLAFVYEQSVDFSNLTCLFRSDGVARSGIKVEWFAHKYDSRLRRRVMTLATQSISDADGSVSAPDDIQLNYSARLSYQGDTLHLINQFLRTFTFTKRRPTTTEVNFFTDRAVYRPGQILYAKGIVFERDTEEKPAIQPNRSIVVTLYDANGQPVVTQNRVSNAYGSFTVQFTLPTNGLLGAMWLGNDLSMDRAYVRVEAYKRPTFEIKVDSSEATYKLNEVVQVSGSVSSYAGASLANIALRYRVVRNANYPYFFFSKRFPYPASPAQEIASGALTTDDLGSFKTSFKAIPDQEVDSILNPVFQYQVTLEATDISGETQNAETIISIGYQPYGLIFENANIINLGQQKNLFFSAQNSNGEPVKVSGAATISLLKSGNKWYRNRYWDLPDFPDTSLQISWYDQGFKVQEAGDTIEIATVPFSDSLDNLILDLSDLELQTGKYQIVTSTQTVSGQRIESRFEIDLIDPNEPYAPGDQLLHTLQDKTSYAVGDTARIWIGSSVGGHVHYRVQGMTTSKNKIKLDDQWQEISIPIRETDRGDLFVHLFLLYQNRIDEKTIRISVPWTNKKLGVQLTTWRDLVKPGATEEVELWVRDYQGQGVASEVLVSMFDASLDAIAPHHWRQTYFPVRASTMQFVMGGFRISNTLRYANGKELEIISQPGQDLPNLDWFGFPVYGSLRHMTDRTFRSSKMENAMPAVAEMAESSLSMEDSKQQTSSPIRENFNETLAFYPQLQSNSKGKLSFEYTMNDALTKWRMMVLVHREDASTGYLEASVVSQKELMVTVNRPRFLRAGDEIQFGGKVDNLTNGPVTVSAELKLSNAITGEDLSQFCMESLSKELHIPEKKSTAIFWTLKIPDNFHMPIEYTVSSSTMEHADAERAIVPVLENRTRVTETLAITVKPQEQKEIDFSSLSVGENTSDPGDLILDLTKNPTWYAIKALPYLMDFPYECSEQVFNKLFAHVLGRHLIKQNPAIKKVFNQWNQEALTTNLMKDDFLKSASMHETPWVREALAETEQMRHVASYFNENTLNAGIRKNLIELAQLQLSSGGFSWFPGGQPNWYITQYVTEGLFYINSWLEEEDRQEIAVMMEKAMDFLDSEAVQYFKNLTDLVAANKAKWEDDHLTPIIIHYLFVRGLTDQSMDDNLRPLFDYYQRQAIKFWPVKPLYAQAQLAHIFRKSGNIEHYQHLIKSLKERIIVDAELGAHWNYGRGFQWWQLPIETHTKLIDLFAENGDEEIVQDLKLWLLNNKRTNHWSSTKSTSDAIRALLRGPSNWIEAPGQVDVDFVGGTLRQTSPEEAGSLYARYEGSGKELEKIPKVNIKNPNNTPVWGSVFYQYFEDFDQVKASDTAASGLQISKELFVEQITPSGKILSPLDQNMLEPGMTVVVQLEFSCDQDMDFIHLQDFRGAALEPIEILSGYRWEGRLSFYRSNSDLTTNFFIENLPRGQYIIQYALYINQVGDFSGGNATIQSMYAPEYEAHTKGGRFSVPVKIQ